MTIQELAKHFLTYFKTGKRPNGETYLFAHNEPEQLYRIIYNAHFDMLANDYSFRYIHECLELISETPTENLEEINIEADIYNSDLLKWLSSNLNRADYVNEYVSDFGFTDLFTVIRGGQYMEKDKILQMILSCLKELIEEGYNCEKLSSK